MTIAIKHYDTKFKKELNPKVGLIALSTDQTIESDFSNICNNLPLDIFINRIHNQNPLTKENLLKMQNDLELVANKILPDEKINTIAYGCTSGTIAIGENKVKEIASKTKSKIVEVKKETKGFSLDDVRQILQVKTKKTTEKPKASSSKATASKPENKSEVSTKRKVAKVKKVQTASIDDILGFGATTQSVRPIRDEKKVPKEWLTYYKNLMNLRASLKGALGDRSQDTLGASARESSGELSLNSSDAGSETFNRDVALSMVANEQEALEEIEDAIDRIFDGSFGICQETQKPIKKTRLKVVPFTRFSLEGQTLYEKRKRKDVDSGGGTFATIADFTMGVEE